MMSTVTRFLGFSLCLLLMGTFLGCAVAPTDGTSPQVGPVYSPQSPAGIETVEAAKRDLAELLAGKKSPGIKYYGEQLTNTLVGEDALVELLKGKSGAITLLYNQEELLYVMVSGITVLDDRIEVSPRMAFSYDNLTGHPIVVEKMQGRATMTRQYGGSGSGAVVTGPLRNYRIQFPGQMAFFFQDPADAQRFADDLFVIQQPLKKEQEKRLALFESKAAAYRALTTKPQVSEEQRKLIVQANALNQRKDYAGAIKLYLQAIDIDPVSYPGAYFNLALLSAQVQRYNPAISYMKQYLQLVPEAADARSAQDKIYEWELMMKK